MKRIFSEVQKRRLLKTQVDLLKQDLNDCLLLLKNRRYRSSYIFLFDALERVFDIFFINEREKPTSRREREELIFRRFSPETYRKFKSFYYERRGGMYEDFALITERDFKALFKFFERILSETKLKKDQEIENLLREIKKFS